MARRLVPGCDREVVRAVFARASAGYTGPRGRDGLRVTAITPSGVPFEASVTGGGDRASAALRYVTETATGMPFFGPRLAAQRAALADLVALPTCRRTGRRRRAGAGRRPAVPRPGRRAGPHPLRHHLRHRARRAGAGRAGGAQALRQPACGPRAAGGRRVSARPARPPLARPGRPAPQVGRPRVPGATLHDRRGRRRRAPGAQALPAHPGRQRSRTGRGRPPVRCRARPGRRAPAPRRGGRSGVAPPAVRVHRLRSRGVVAPPARQGAGPRRGGHGPVGIRHRRAARRAHRPGRTGGGRRTVRRPRRRGRRP